MYVCECMQAKQEPSPLGDLIYFFSSDTPARKLADFRYMESKFPTFALSRGDGYAARLDMQWLHNFAGKGAADRYKEGFMEERRSGGEGGGGGGGEEEGDEEEDIEGVAVVKSDTSK
jgi:hypothetical protein